MSISERRVIGALLLLLGVTFLTVSIYSKQVDQTIEMLKTAFRTAVT